MSSDSNQFSAPSSVIVQSLGDEMVFFHTVRGEYLTLDAIAARIYTLLLEVGQRATCERLLVEFEAEPSVIDRDVDALVTRLVSSGYLDARDS